MAERYAMAPSAVFGTIQGEGLLLGVPMAFVRLAGCSVGCDGCPVLPSPSRNPRRGDDIVMEYRDLLFDQLRLDPRNIIYSSEYNPFEVYRQIRKAAIQYHDVLGLIGGCKIALSALCSKLMSLGVLLVGYELKAANSLQIGIAHIECQGYDMPNSVVPNPQPVGLWLAGECYG